MPDCTLAANACVAACTLLVLGVALTCCVRWPFWFGGSDLSVTGERFSCYGRAFFLLREADFSVGRIDFSTSRKCFSAFAQVHLSPLTSVFLYSCRWFSVFSQVFYVFSQVFLCILAGVFLCSYKRITFFAWAVGVYASRASPPPHPALLWRRMVMLLGVKKTV